MPTWQTIWHAISSKYTKNSLLFFVSGIFHWSDRSEFTVQNVLTLRNGHTNIGLLVTLRTRKCLLHCGGQVSSKDAQLEDLEEAGIYRCGIEYGTALWGEVWPRVSRNEHCSNIALHYCWFYQLSTHNYLVVDVRYLLHKYQLHVSTLIAIFRLNELTKNIGSYIWHGSYIWWIGFLLDGVRDLVCIG